MKLLYKIKSCFAPKLSESAILILKEDIFIEEYRANLEQALERSLLIDEKLNKQLKSLSHGRL